MGVSASICSTPRSQIVSAFVDQTLRDGEIALKLDHSLRARFIDFIKEGSWSDSLDSFETSISRLNSSSESLWRQFGYKSPHSYNRSIRTSFDKESSFKSYSTESDCETPGKSSSSTYKSAMMDECYKAITMCKLFQEDDLQPVLIAALWPIFKKECDDNKIEGIIADIEESDTEKEEDDISEVTDSVRGFVKLKPSIQKTHRLQEWLLGAAAMFDSFELEAYLSETKSWIDDFLRALQKLPVTVTLSTVDAFKQESKIVYTNTTHGTQGQVGANVHEVYSADCTAYVVGQVTKAVFSAKKYKRCVVTPNGLYKLRALKPVFSVANQHAYTLGLESISFEDPIIQDKRKIECDEPFQQIEDLLLMLPLFIRNYDHVRDQ